MDVITFGETMVSCNSVNNRSIVQHDEMRTSIAGSESNVSIALARLGNKVKWVSRVSDDLLGQKILYELNAHCIDTSEVIVDPRYSTGFMFKQKKNLLDSEIIYYREQTAASKMTKEDMKEDSIKNATIIHITGITPALSSSCKKLVTEAIRLAKKHGTIISFDPNIRLKLWDVNEIRDTLIPIIKESDIFLPGKSEMKILCNTENFNDIKESLTEWKIPLTIMKDGSNGAWIFEHEESKFVPSFKVERVVDEVGAGDAFAAGFIHGYLQKQSHESAVRIGHACAAFVVSSEGDIDGLPTKSELERFLSNDKGTIR